MTVLQGEDGFVRRSGIMVDRRIRQYVDQFDMIEPFIPRKIRNGVISYGLSSVGYDIRIADEFKVCVKNDPRFGYIDPKDPRDYLFDTFRSPSCIIPPNSFILGRTIEYFRVPKNVICVCVGKSTYARCGLIVNVTPFEPGWEGYVTLEVSNTTPLPAKIYANEGIAQVLFFECEEDVETDYGTGTYQQQGPEIIHARVNQRGDD